MQSISVVLFNWLNSRSRIYIWFDLIFFQQQLPGKYFEISYCKNSRKYGKKIYYHLLSFFLTFWLWRILKDINCVKYMASWNNVNTSWKWWPIYQPRDIRNDHDLLGISKDPTLCVSNVGKRYLWKRRESNIYLTRKAFTLSENGSFSLLLEQRSRYWWKSSSNKFKSFFFIQPQICEQITTKKYSHSFRSRILCHEC